MRIELRVKEVAQLRGVQNITELKDRVGVAYDTAADLWHGRMQRIDRDTLARVCAALQCDPGDVLVRMDDDDDSTDVIELKELMTQGVAA
jgi:putative transcriptional regulator